MAATTSSRETARIYAFPLKSRLATVANERIEKMAKSAQLCGTVVTDAWYHQAAMEETKSEQ